MEKQKLPNDTLILVLGISSIVTVCCCYGIIGLPCSIITLILAISSEKTYFQNPELYMGYENVKAGKILSIIGIVINSLYFIYLMVSIIFWGFTFSAIPWDALQ